MAMKVARITLVRAAEEHYHHQQTKLKNLTQHNSCTTAALLSKCYFHGGSGPCLAAHDKHLCLKETHRVWMRPAALIKNI